MELKITSMSPNKTLSPGALVSLAPTNNAAPEIPKNKPIIFAIVILSLKILAAIMVIIIGVINVSKEA